MTLPSKVHQFIERHGCLFHQPWWLDAVCEPPWKWDCVWVERGREIAAAWPFAYKMRFGYRLIEMPQMTPYLGPILRPCTAKYAERLAEGECLLTGLIEQLPPCAVFHQNFHHSITNWLPLFWKGFQQTTHYTYLIPDTSNLDSLWGELRSGQRGHIRRAKEIVKVHETSDFRVLLEMIKLTLARQNIKLSHTDEFMRSVDSVCAERKARRILVASDTKGRIHTASYQVWDQTTVYLLMNGSDPVLRNSGAASLLTWEAIQLASSMGRRLDFEGSIKESIERFNRAFGAIQTPYLVISKTDSPLVGAYRKICGWGRKGVL